MPAAPAVVKGLVPVAVQRGVPLALLSAAFARGYSTPPLVDEDTTGYIQSVNDTNEPAGIKP